MNQGETMFTINVEPDQIDNIIAIYRAWLSPEQIRQIKSRNQPFMIVRNAPLSTLIIWGSNGKDNSNT